VTPKHSFILFLFSLGFCLQAQTYTKKDSLRGTLNSNRSWWDVLYYDLKVKINAETKSITGSNYISYKPVSKGNVMQIDLQEPLKIDSVIYHARLCSTKNFLNIWLIDLPDALIDIEKDSITIFYSGKPRPAKFAPWDGGISWTKDEKKRHFIGVSCQGLGASVWWPNKDHQSDEPDKGMKISVTIPDSLVNISNGNLISVNKHNNGTATWIYKVNNPINNYDVTMNVGKFVTVTDTFKGRNGALKIEYVVLDYNEEKIETHLKKDTKNMLSAFEYWFGPYPFYEDGYRLVETSYLGMEHQSAIAYGNKFRKGYLGRDRSGSGVGMLWDFIIIHESGHEWFGNNITIKDVADMWIHEGFTTYSEVLFLEYNYNKDSAEKYIVGLRKNILNDKPMIGDYGVNKEGSGDVYDKGANMIHTIRHVMNNDSAFHKILLGLNKDFAKKTVTTKEIEEYMIFKSGEDLAPIFDQYLRRSTVPQFQYELKKGKLIYRWANCNKGFNMSVKIYLDNKTPLWLNPLTQQQEIDVSRETKSIIVDKNFYVITVRGFK